MERHDALKGIRNTKPLHFIGLGGAGCNALDHIYRKGIQAKYTCIDHRMRLDLPQEIEFIRFTSVGRNPFFYDERLTLADDIKELFVANHRFCLLAGLGGYTGTSLAMELTIWLHHSETEFLTICSCPFSFEGGSRRSTANKSKMELASISNFISFNLDDTITEDFGKLTIKGVYARADEQFYLVYKATLG